LGAGLGLAIVAAVADEQDGSVTAANTPGGGAVFTIRLPLVPKSFVLALHPHPCATAELICSQAALGSTGSSANEVVGDYDVRSLTTPVGPVRPAKTRSAAPQPDVSAEAHAVLMPNRSEPTGDEAPRLRSTPPRPKEDHGRELTTTPEAARWYRSAQGHYLDQSFLAADLRLAVLADPGFALAAADLAALNGAQPTRATPSLRAWERHHMEVVTAAADANARRAVDLLREHLTVVACDPIATVVVLGAGGQERLDDILEKLPGCHPQPAPEAQGEKRE
jgi:hypothetical protein